MSISLVDELVITSKLQKQQSPKYPHGWLDNNGKNVWEYWITYLEDKENTIWEATLKIANSTNGEKVLYEIYPIKMVEQSVKPDTSYFTTKRRACQEVFKRFSRKRVKQRATGLF